MSLSLGARRWSCRQYIIGLYISQATTSFIFHLINCLCSVTQRPLMQMHQADLSI